MKMILKPITKLLMSARDAEDGATAPMTGLNYWLCVTNCLDKIILLMKEANKGEILLSVVVVLMTFTHPN